MKNGQYLHHLILKQLAWDKWQVIRESDSQVVFESKDKRKCVQFIQSR